MNLTYKCLFAVLTAALTLPSTAAIFGYENYWDCILGEMPEVQNDVAAYAVARDCNLKHPSRSVTERRFTFLGFNRTECIKKYAKKTSSRVAAAQISMACANLYGE